MVNREKRASLKWMEAACEGCGVGSKMTWIVLELSENMWTDLISGRLVTIWRISSAVCAMAYISASKLEVFFANLTHLAVISMPLWRMKSP